MNNSTALLLRFFSAIPPQWRDKISAMKWRHPFLRRFLSFAGRRVRNTDLEIQEGIGKGLRFNTGGSAVSFIMGSSQRLEQQAVAALLRRGMTFYDIGANVGFFSVIGARLVGNSGRIFCFEPLPENFRQIRYNATLNGFDNVHVIETALGSFNGSASFWTSAELTWGKLVSTGKAPDKLTGEITVPVRRLDAVVAESELPPPDVIKIDVEGAEVDVLEGAAETLRRYRPALLIELHGTNARVARILHQMGYQTTVLGSSLKVAEAHWNAHTVAIPHSLPWPDGLQIPCSKEDALGANG